MDPLLMIVLLVFVGYCFLVVSKRLGKMLAKLCTAAAPFIVIVFLLLVLGRCT